MQRIKQAGSAFRSVPHIVLNTKMSYFSKVSYDRSLMVAGLELDYDVNLDEVIGAGGQGDVFRAKRKEDMLEVAVKVTQRSRLRPGPGVCSHLSIFVK